MGANVIAVLLGAILVCLAGSAFSICRKLRISLQAKSFSDAALYERGRQGAQRDDDKGDVGVLGKMLQDAGVESSPSMWLACVLAVLIVVGLFAFQATGAVGAASGIFLACACVFLYLARAKTKRRELLASQFVRLLPQLSASVKSAQTVERAFRASVNCAQEPIRSELAWMLARVSYGEPLVSALEDMAKRTGSEDIAAFAASMRIQQRFGGPVNKVIDLVCDHANERMRTKRELQTELAGTRLATWFVAGAMPVIFALMFATSADFSTFYRTEPFGWLVLAGAGLMEVIGVVACRKITTFRTAGFS